jgi:hypothetical protein
MGGNRHKAEDRHGSFSADGAIGCVHLFNKAQSGSATCALLFNEARSGAAATRIFFVGLVSLQVLLLL